MVVMDPDLRRAGDGFGGRDYGESEFNKATQALRQPGSSFKSYVYAAALSTGLYRPNTKVTDRPASATGARATTTGVPIPARCR